MPAWWGTRANVSPRLRLEVEAMRATFADTFRLHVPESGKLYWQGAVDINMAGVKPREHVLKVVYPDNYPSVPAEAYVVKPYITSDKHQYVDGQLCLFNPRDGEQYGWNPSKSTAVTVAAWAIQWLYAYYTFRATAQWPGVEERINNDLPDKPRFR